jgi:hypothetical protein
MSQDSSSLNHNSADMDFLRTRCNLILHGRMISDVKQSLSLVKKKVSQTELTLNMRPPDFDTQEMEIWNKKVDALVNHKQTIPFPKFREIRKEIRQENEELLRKIAKEKEDQRLLLLPGRMRYQASLDSVRTSKLEFKTEVADKMKNINFGEPIKGDVIKIIENYKGANCMIQGDKRVLVRKSRIRDTLETPSGLPLWMGVGYYTNTDPSYLKDKSEMRYKLNFLETNHHTSDELRNTRFKHVERNKLYRRMASLPSFMEDAKCARPHSREEFYGENDISPWSRESAKSLLGLHSPLSSRGKPPKTTLGDRSISRDQSGRIHNQFRDIEYGTHNEFDPNADAISAGSRSKRSLGSTKSSGSTIIRRQSPEPPKTYGKSYMMENTLEGKNAMAEQTSYQPWRRDYTMGALQMQTPKSRAASAKKASRNGKIREQFDDGRDLDFVPDDAEVKVKNTAGDDESFDSSESIPQLSHELTKSVLSQNSFHEKLTKDFVNYQNHINRHNGFLKPKQIKKVKPKPEPTEDDMVDKLASTFVYDKFYEDEIDRKQDEHYKKLKGQIATLIEERDLQLEALKSLGMKENEYNNAVSQCMDFNSMKVGPLEKELINFKDADEDRREARRIAIEQEEARVEGVRKELEEREKQAKLDETFTGDVEELRRHTMMTVLQKSLKKQAENTIRDKSNRTFSPPKMTVTATNPPLHANIDKHLSEFYVANDVYLPEKPKCLAYRNFPDSVKEVNLKGLLYDEDEINNDRLYKAAILDAEIAAEVDRSSDITNILQKKKTKTKPSVLSGVDPTGNDGWQLVDTVSNECEPADESADGVDTGDAEWSHV